ncbi:MAG: preprotein translocase subunit SecG [Rubritalea sp.]|jgi:preprotein translocase subunit SecG
MTILAETAGWNSIITNVLLVVHVVVCILLCLVVLMQRPKQEGLGAAFGGGMTDQAFGARTTDVLQKGTVYLASLLFLVTLVLSILVGTKSRDASISGEIETNGASAIEENLDAAAALMANDEQDLTAAIKAATGVGEDKAESEEGAETPDPVVPTPALEPNDPAPPLDPKDPATLGQ